MNIPEMLFPVSGSKPVTNNGGVTCDYISLKNAVRCWAVIHLTRRLAMRRRSPSSAPRKLTELAM